MIRLDASWMCQMDERILEFLASYGGAAKPHRISLECESWSWGRVNARCRVLADAGLVAVGRGEFVDEFSITADGEAYLAGQIDAQLRRPVPAPRPSYAVRPAWWAGFG